MKIILSGLEQYGLEGEFDLDRHPTGREMNRFRKEAEMSPSELTDAVSGSGLDVVRLYAYTALARAGLVDAAAKVLDVPLDLLKGIEVETDDDDEQEEGQLPPTLGSGSNESERSDAEPSGPSLSDCSALPE
jgi:hypothetical protein